MRLSTRLDESAESAFEYIERIQLILVERTLSPIERD